MHESQFKTRKCLDCSLTLQILKLKTKNQCDRQQLVDTGTMRERERESKRFWVVNLGREAKLAFYFERWGKGGKFVIFGEVGLVGWARDLTIWSCGRSGPLRGDFNGWWGKSNWMRKLKKTELEMRGIDPRTSRMLSERSTIWATSPDLHLWYELLII